MYPLRGSRTILRNNIKMDLRETGYEDGRWQKLDEDLVQ
jgi:hypothetical protein